MEDDVPIGLDLTALTLLLNGLIYLIIAISRPELYLARQSGVFLLGIGITTSITSLIAGLGLLKDKSWGWHLAFSSTIVIVSVESVVPMFINTGFDFLKITVGFVVLWYLFHMKEDEWREGVL